MEAVKTLSELRVPRELAGANLADQMMMLRINGESEAKNNRSVCGCPVVPMQEVKVKPGQCSCSTHHHVMNQHDAGIPRTSWTPFSADVRSQVPPSTTHPSADVALAQTTT
ncbi:unnamed protein product [Protopolystoma xenopodis]|uniref:Uncharacterized protein n=1 Tax=Protopolystoma xenopodis TaxID=117903 RepID=A0A3S5AWK9_9PLAT|nr:unnamed protein product [Protopolystoma xenopodis]